MKEMRLINQEKEDGCGLFLFCMSLSLLLVLFKPTATSMPRFCFEHAPYCFHQGKHSILSLTWLPTEFFHETRGPQLQASVKKK